MTKPLAKLSKLKNLLTIREICHLFNVHPNTLRNWDKNGKLKAIRIGPRKDRRYRKDDILSFFYGKKAKKEIPPTGLPSYDLENLEPLGDVLPSLEGEEEEK